MLAKPLTYTVRIKQNSFFAKCASRIMKANNLAIVFRKTVHLHNITAHQFLVDEELMRHELQHVIQYKEQGWLIFVIKYLWFSFKNGYFNNPFEVEARNMEYDTDLLKRVTWIW
jgi:hypothetical protein